MQPMLMLKLSLNYMYKHIFFHVANISKNILIPEFTKDCLVKFFIPILFLTLQIGTTSDLHICNQI